MRERFWLLRGVGLGCDDCCCLERDVLEHETAVEAKAIVAGIVLRGNLLRNLCCGFSHIERTGIVWSLRIIVWRAECGAAVNAGPHSFYSASLVWLPWAQDAPLGGRSAVGVRQIVILNVYSGTVQ